MFERFTDKARAVVILAKAKATERGDQIRPVYMLHALASAEGVAARESKQSLGLALKEARGLRHNYIGTEHLLLGLLRMAERNHRGDFTPDTLRELGIDPAQVRQRVLAAVRCASA
jgi:Clp amino terminal domain, pathogenicity island component